MLKKHADITMLTVAPLYLRT